MVFDKDRTKIKFVEIPPNVLALSQCMNDSASASSPTPRNSFEMHKGLKKCMLQWTLDKAEIPIIHTEIKNYAVFSTYFKR